MMDIVAVIYIELINLLKNFINRNSGTHIRFQLILILFKGNIILPIQKKSLEESHNSWKKLSFCPPAIIIKTAHTLSSLTDHQDGIKTGFYKKSAMIRDISSGVHSCD
jgi:hypothetical protein